MGAVEAQSDWRNQFQLENDKQRKELRIKESIHCNVQPPLPRRNALAGLRAVTPSACTFFSSLRDWSNAPQETVGFGENWALRC